MAGPWVPVRFATCALGKTGLLSGFQQRVEKLCCLVGTSCWDVPIEIRNLALGYTIMWSAHLLHAPDINRVAAGCFRSEILFKLLEIIEDHSLRRTRSTIEPMLNYDTALRLQHFSNGGELFRSHNLAPVRSPIILLRTPTCLDSDLIH